MIVAIDIGNTTVGVYFVEKEAKDIHIVSSFKLPTDASWSAATYAKELKLGIQNFFLQEACNVEKVIISSVVPLVEKAVKQAVSMFFGMDALELDASMFAKTDNIMLNMQVNEPQKVGFDRIADAIGAAGRYPLPLVTVDMGTATTFNVVEEGNRFLGGAIAPGIVTGLDALSRKAAKLPQIPLEAPAQVIGRDTISCMQSGAVFGAAAMVDGMIARFEAQLGKKVTVVMTGGGAGIVHPLCMHEHIYDPYLLIKGLVIFADFM